MASARVGVRASRSSSPGASVTGTWKMKVRSNQRFTHRNGSPVSDSTKQKIWRRSKKARNPGSHRKSRVDQGELMNRIVGVILAIAAAAATTSALATAQQPPAGPGGGQGRGAGGGRGGPIVPPVAFEDRTGFES